MLGVLLRPDLEELIRKQDFKALREAFSELDPPDLAEILEEFPVQDSAVVFRILPRDMAAETFEYLPLEVQTRLVQGLADEQLVNILNGMAPDDRTRLFEELPPEVTRRALASLSPDELKIARQLLGYPEGCAGRYMTPEYIAIRPTDTTAEALQYIRRNGKDRETLNVVYVTDNKGKLLDDLKLSTLVLADPQAKVEDLNDGQVVSIPATADRAEIVAAFEKYDRVALPVTDSRGALLGIITVDDVLDVAEAEATEDIQKLGGMEALDAPYLNSSLGDMIRKRAGWLLVLFVGEMLTATSVDLAGKDATLPTGSGVTGITRSATFTFAAPATGPFAAELGSHVVVVEGTADKGGMQRVFRAEVDLPELLNANKEPAIVGCTFKEVDMQADGTVTVTIKPSLWFDQVEFDTIPASTDGKAVLMDPSTLGRKELVLGMLASDGYVFSYQK